MANNPIRELIRAKIKGLYAQFEESKSITHRPTLGALREQYLTEFLKNVLPNKYLIKSGFLVDSKSDEITPQIDLIVADKHSMPSFSLNESTSLIPIESALLTAEIKSVITGGENGTLNQIQRQRAVINKLKVDFLLNLLFGSQLINNLHSMQILLPTVLIAFESQVNEAELKEWLEKENNLLAICVIGKFCITKLTPPHGVTVINGNGKQEETLFFIGKLYHTINEIARMRSTYEPNWDNYLQDIIPTGIMENKSK